jgi:histone deacetylase 6
MTDADYVAAFQKIVMPIAYEFRPDFVLGKSTTISRFILIHSHGIPTAPVSAGFDAAEGDQLGGCHVSPGGYAQMTHMLSALAGGRMVIALEVRIHLDYMPNL